MTIDEAIKHAEEVAKKNEQIALDLTTTFNRETINSKECKKCAEEHRQLAEWLKDYKRLLREENERRNPDSCPLSEEETYNLLHVYNLLHALHGDLVDTYTLDECWEIVITGEWIPVSEKLPEERDWYLAVFKEKDTSFQLIPRVADYIGKDENKWRIIDEYGLPKEYRDKLECIAWMPLPEPYKTESENKE